MLTLKIKETTHKGIQVPGPLHNITSGLLRHKMGKE